MGKSKFILFCFLFAFGALNAQFKASGFTDLGHVSIYNDLYLKAVAQLAYTHRTWEAEVLMQTSPVSANSQFITGCNIRLSKTVDIKSNQFSVQPFYLFTSTTDYVYQTNWGIVLSTKNPKWNAKVGTNFRTIGLSQTATTEFGINSNTRVHENFNLMYALSYDFKPVTEPLNIGVTLTNFDYFLIHQETNPMTNVHGHWDINNKLRLFSEVWYQTAGAFNLHVNYYGFFVRTGIIWKIK